MKIFIVSRQNVIIANNNATQRKMIYLFTDVLDAISALIYSKVDLLIIESSASSDQDETLDLIFYINKDVPVIFLPQPVSVING